MSSGERCQFILMPARGTRAADPHSAVARTFLEDHDTGTFDVRSAREAGDARPSVRVLDSIGDDGAKLIETTPQGALALRADQPGLRLVPVVYYRPALARRPEVARRPLPTARAGRSVTAVRIVSRRDRRPIPHATVVAFTDFANRVGCQGITGKGGVAHLSLPPSARKLERLYVFPERGFWSLLSKRVTLGRRADVALIPLDPSYGDGVRHFFGASARDNGDGVTVGVIDSGVDTAHPDLVLAGGLNTVLGEDPADYGDNGRGHGTHVAGVVAARGTAPGGRLGLAPAVALRSYRVFAKGAEQASNFAIAKAIDRAVGDGCDLINLSLGSGPRDPLTEAAIAEARSAGTLVIVAAGNDERRAVGFPAADERAVAVSALGRRGTFPAESAERDDIAPPFGADSRDFVAAFSSVGREIDLTAPGVGVISTVPGGYAVMSGTSMACPVVAGFAARLLASLPEIRKQGRDQDRSDALAQVLFKTARSLGFPSELEGHGLPSL